VVVRYTKSISAAFDLNTATFRVWQPDMSDFIAMTPDISLANANTTVVMTATDFPLYGSGMRLEFIIGYEGISNISADAIYPISVTYRNFLPSVVKPAPPVNDGSNPCTAIVAQPGTQYTTSQITQYRFFSLTVPTISTVYMTATNYTLDGQMQLRRPPALPCNPTGIGDLVDNYYNILPVQPIMTAYVITPGYYLARFSIDAATPTSTVPFNFKWSYQPSLLEPNNTLCTALPVQPNITYQAHPDDQYDYYRFDTNVAATIGVTVSGFNTSGQYQILKDNPDCIHYGWPPLVTTDASQGVVSLTAPNQPPGRYYLGVLNTSRSYNVSSSYSFRIILTPASAEVENHTQTSLVPTTPSPQVPEPPPPEVTVPVEIAPIGVGAPRSEPPAP
jgi:hypothetical protein